MDITCNSCQHTFKVPKKKLAVNCPSCNMVNTLKKKKKSSFSVKPTVIANCGIEFSSIKYPYSGHILFTDDEIYFGLLDVGQSSKGLAGILGIPTSVDDLTVSIGIGNIKLPFRSVIPRSLPDDVRYCGKFNSLGNDHKVVIVERKDIQGFKKKWFSTNIICKNGIIIKLSSRKDIIEALLTKGFNAL